MIHDAVVEVTCDGKGCRESVYVGLEFVYGGVMHTRGHYDHEDRSVEPRLQDQHGWLIQDGKHYCSASCAAR